MYGSRQTKILNSVCLLLVLMTGAVRLIRSCFAGVSSNTVIFACLITALILWTAGVRKRLVQPEERKYITYTAALIILLMAVRTVKFVFLPPGHVLTRYAWYLYYVPQTFTALFIFLAVLHIGKPADMPINRLWSLLYIPAALISAGIVTNDFHGLAFVFPEGLDNWSEVGVYFHGPLYYISIIWAGALFAAILIIVFLKCTVRETRKNIWLPALPVVFAAVYIAEFFIIPGGILGRMFKAAEIIGFTMAAFAECLILAGFFPSNDSYGALWHASDLGGGIMDDSGNICYCAQKSVPVNKSQVIAAQKRPVKLDGGGILLRSHRINGGYGYWIKDVSAINAVNEKLSELGDIMAEENSMLEGENRLRANSIAIEEKSRLYDSISEDLEPQILSLSDILSKLPEEETAFEQAMKHAAIFTAYIKRRSNMLLIANEQSFITAAELNLAVAESLEYISFYGVKTHGEYGEGGLLPKNSALTAYKLFECVAEKSVPGARGIIVSTGTENGFVMNMEISSPREFIGDGFMAEEIALAGGRLKTEWEGNTLFVSLFLPKGGKDV